jgi:bifunctional non-homologous end joining protein LigD
VVDGLAPLLWAVNIGSLELHTSLHLRGDLHRPTTVAFDLDPGPGVDVLRCGEVALLLRDLLASIGLESYAKTSGSKGLQVYVPLNTAVGYAETKPFARAIAEALEAHAPDRIVARMAKALRGGKVLIDWSQNTEHKSMVCVYSLRARGRPTVSTPVAWDEVETAIGADDPARLVFDIDDVLARIERDGDLFADVLTLQQRLDQAWAVPGSASA